MKGKVKKGGKGLTKPTETGKAGRTEWVTVFADVTETFTKRVRMKIPADRASGPEEEVEEAIREAFEEACSCDDIDVTRDSDDFSREIDGTWSAADFRCDCAHCAGRDTEEGLIYCSAFDRTVGMDDCCNRVCAEYVAARKAARRAKAKKGGK